MKLPTSLKPMKDVSIKIRLAFTLYILVYFLDFHFCNATLLIDFPFSQQLMKIMPRAFLEDSGYNHGGETQW